MEAAKGRGRERAATIAIALAGGAWMLGILVILAMPDPPYLPPDVDPAVRLVVLGVWVAGLTLVPGSLAVLSLIIAVLCLQRARAAAPPAPGPKGPPSRSISARLQTRGAEPTRQSARLAAALSGSYLVGCAAAAVLLLALGMTPGEALSPALPTSIGAQRLVQFGHQLEELLRERDARTLAAFLDQRRFLERVRRLAPDDRPRLRSVRESIEGLQLAERVLERFPPGAPLEVTRTEAGPPALLTFEAGGEVLQFEIGYGRHGYLTVVEVHDEAGPWSEQLLHEARGR